ncbi:hypothetical protein [Geoalkalibacter halelectricus]|uniref:hypothetical protein n=1 Tax=Geoalkalibacter halelectricus TaxID=2847045 RepID=UPI003D190704
MIEDYSAARFWFDIAQVGGLIALGVYSWWRDREKITAKRFKVLEDEVAARVTRQALEDIEEKRAQGCVLHGRRVADLEGSVGRMGTEMRFLPSRAELAHLSDGMKQLAAQLGKVEGRLDGINRAADLMNEFLINQGGRK